MSEEYQADYGGGPEPHGYKDRNGVWVRTCKKHFCDHPDCTHPHPTYTDLHGSNGWMNEYD